MSCGHEHGHIILSHFCLTVRAELLETDQRIPECQSELNVSLSGYLDGRGEDVDPVPQQPPSGEMIAVVGEISVVQRGHVDGEDVLAALRRHHVALDGHSLDFSAEKVSGSSTN